MENIAIEELLSSFGSDAFTIQSQPEKDLRASLINFFSLQHDLNNTSPVRFLNQTNPSSDQVQTGIIVSSTCSQAELPPCNTPIGSPRKEESVHNSAINCEGNYINMDSNPHCLACLNTVSFNQNYSAFPHAQNCHHFDKFNTSNNHPVVNDINPSDNLSPPTPFRIDGFRPS